MLVLRLLSSFFKHLCWFCVHGRDVCPEERETLTGGGIKPEQAPLLNHIPIPSTEQGASINPVCIRRRRQLPKKTTTTVFVRVGKFRDSSLFRILSLSLLDRRVFDQGTDSRRTGSRRTGIIFDHAGLSHEGLDSNNFVVAQHTTYFEDYLLRNLQFFDQLRRQLLHIVRPYHGVDRSPDYRFL